LKIEEQIDELSEKAEDLLLESDQQESVAVVAIYTGAPDADVATLAAEEASSCSSGSRNALEAISEKQMADRERDERA
jgi:hypothetical protein